MHASRGILIKELKNLIAPTDNCVRNCCQSLVATAQGHWRGCTSPFNDGVHHSINVHSNTCFLTWSGGARQGHHRTSMIRSFMYGHNAKRKKWLGSRKTWRLSFGWSWRSCLWIPGSVRSSSPTTSHCLPALSVSQQPPKICLSPLVPEALNHCMIDDSGEHDKGTSEPQQYKCSCVPATSAE